MSGRPIPGFVLDDSVYIGGDFTVIEAEWLEGGKDLSRLAGRPDRLAFKVRGARLYAIQFVAHPR